MFELDIRISLSSVLIVAAIGALLTQVVLPVGLVLLVLAGGAAVVWVAVICLDALVGVRRGR